MTTYNSAVESATKQAVRGQIAGGASTVSEPITNAILAEYNSTVQGETWPEWVAGTSVPTWVDDVTLHDANGLRYNARQIQTRSSETQVYGEPSPYGPPPQTRQLVFWNTHD